MGRYFHTQADHFRSSVLYLYCKGASFVTPSVYARAHTYICTVRLHYYITTNKNFTSARQSVGAFVLQTGTSTTTL